MTPVFLDTSGLLAVVNTRDERHETALQAWTRLVADRTPLVTTSLILVELADGLAKVGWRRRAIELRDSLEKTPQLDIVFADENILSAGWKLYGSRLDKSWSLTDCVSIVVAESRAILQFFAHDSDFIQAGFENLILGRPKPAG